ncbi:diguanylate cyclase [Neorhizobium sp. SOG26]|jgi:ABC-type dipeptide/oligopeptide/nickel transport systems, permease components|uniref:ABC transporter permease n=1 Tax=Neorhizobium turbinariae TaxID=2937795 RepID=A0ABT0IKW8_9HYPH|nr:MULTISPECIES: ABC transporter permease [Neorhizobium]AXV15791.1 diguanylate cyclase [Neorhizobium sp. SOG26]MCK8778527.1 ABC transporter permease [Neorhizobium turbinariae]
MLRAIFSHPSGRIGGAIVLLYVVIALLGLFDLTPHDPLQQYRIDRLKAPSAVYWMGTDLFGRDVASRLMKGVGQSFLVGISAVAIASVAGTVLGLTAAWFGKLWDGLVMRVMDVLLAFPAILLALLIIAIAGPGTWTSVAAIAIVYTPIFTRVVRGPALSIKSREFVDAARTFGSSKTYILTRHLLLNLVAPLTVQVTLALAWSLLTEAGLSFLGLGTQPPASSLGLMLADSRNLMEKAPWLLIFPAIAIMISILGFNLLGDALRDILDPKTRSRTA